MNTKTHPEIAEYVARLRTSMGDLAPERRDEIVSEIEEHIEEALAEMPSPTDADIRNLLERVGDPRTIAAEALERSVDDDLAERPPRRYPAAFLAFLRRHLRKILIALLSLVLGFAGFSAWYVTRFDPLHANLHGNPFRVATQTGRPLHVNTIDPVTARPFHAYSVEYRDKEWFEYGFTLANTSPFSVTVEEISVRPEGLFPSMQISISRESELATNPSRIAMRPLDAAFSIPAHSARYVVIRGTFTGCPFSGAGNTATAYLQKVRFRFLGVGRTEFLPLPYSIEFSGRTGCTGAGA